MFRYLSILLFLLLFSGIYVRKADASGIPATVVIRQDTINTVAKKSKPVAAANTVKKILEVPDSVRFAPKIPPQKAAPVKVNIVSVKPGFRYSKDSKAEKQDSLKLYISTFQAKVKTPVKPAVILPPDSVRFAQRVPPEKAGEMPVKVVKSMAGISGKKAKGTVKDKKADVYIKVLRKEDQSAWLTTVAPQTYPSEEVWLVPLEDTLDVPEWYLNRQREAAEEARNRARMKADSMKAPKPKIIKQWNLSADFVDEVPVVFDTLSYLFNRYRVADLYSPVNATMGNYGLPYYSLNFFDRINDPDKFLYFHNYSFLHANDNALFNNLQMPFTELKWTMAGEKEVAEQTFRIKHTQNINRKLNFGLIYDIIFNLGQYTSQRAENKTFTLYTSYTGSIYKLYVSTGVNGIFGQENGGITSKEDLNIDVPDTRDIPVRLGTLNNASSQLKNRNALVVQKITFIGAKKDNDSVPVINNDPVPLKASFNHIFQIDYSRRTYSDESPGSGFYDSIYINTAATFDSLSSTIVKNTFRFDFLTDETKHLVFNAGFGLRNENFWFGQIIPVQDSVVSDTSNWFRGNNVWVGRFNNRIGKDFRWGVNGEWYFDRYCRGDYVLNAVVAKSFRLKKGKLEWQLTGGVNSRTPSFWYQQWGGNHFWWENNFGKESRKEFGSRITYPARNLDIRFNFARITNYLDFDTLAMPAQDTSGLSVMSLGFKKDFKLWFFHFAPDVIVQKSSNENVLELPQITTRTAIYLEHTFYFKKTNGRLFTELGLDITYHSLYHPYNYMPATGRFYRQTETETGNYPFVNAFVNIKLKRTRFFLMFDHLNYSMMKGDMLKNYQMLPLYPMPIRRFSFGLAWTFYN